MTKKKVLVVDDQIGIRLLLSEILGSNGYEVQEASTGKEAIDQLKQATFDLIILDYKLPIMDGAEVLQTLETDNINIPALVMSGLVENVADDVKKYKIVEKVIAKPFNIGEFVQEVNEVITKYN